MAAPDTVHVTYRNIDGVHVFTSEDVRGLYVAGRNLRQAYEDVPQALHDLFKFNKIEASYQAKMSTDEFIRSVSHFKDDDIHRLVIFVST
jgi:uncharacterized protein DUF1902